MAKDTEVFGKWLITRQRLCLGPLMWEQSCLAFVERLLGDVKHLSRRPMHQRQKNRGVGLRLQ